MEFSAAYTFARCLDLENRSYLDHQEGVSPQTRKRAVKLFGQLPRTLYNKGFSEWPVYFGPKYDMEAAKFRVRLYCNLFYEVEIKAALSERMIPSAAFKIFSQFKQAENGVIRFPSAAEEALPQQHSVTIVGYNDDAGYFTFQNSWGKSWGDDGFGYLPYGYLEKYSSDVAIHLSPKRAPGPEEAILAWTSNRMHRRLTSTFTSPFGRVFNLIEVFSLNDSTEVAWAICFENDAWLEVEEFFVSPQHRRKEYGRDLLEALKLLAKQQFRQLRVHVPIVDCVTLGPDIHDVAFKLDLLVAPPVTYWAGKTLTPL